MKKFSLSFAAIAVFFTVSAASASQVNLGIGLGASHPKAPDKWGFNSKLFVNYGINQYFNLGIESGIDWVSISRGRTEKQFGGIGLTTKNKTNFYSIPVLFTAQMSLPLGLSIKPYVLGGIGYSWTIWDNIPGSDNSRTFGGFTGQALIGAAYNLGAGGANMDVFIEGGYRWADVKTDIHHSEWTLEMSGILLRAGVSFPILTSAYM